MNKILVVLLVILCIASCKSKKTTLADDDTVGITDFVDFFEDIKLPYQIDDSVLSRKETDSSTIGYKIFTQFISDTVLTQQFGKNVKPKIYPLGKVSIKKFETYLFVKAVSPSKKVGYIIALDKDNKYITGMPLLVADKDPLTVQNGGMDSKYAVIQTVQNRKSDGQVTESKNVYILNSELQAFSLIMTDKAIGAQEQEIINPIDTFPRKNKFSGEYIKNKRNFISIRDGNNSSTILFFIHFEKDNGECTGELKGEAILHGTKTAIYRANGNPCVLELSFSGNSISMKEQAACGSYRGIKCFFDGSYPKLKETKPKSVTRKR